MKLALAVDAILPPMTGIGRYAWALASRFARAPQFESVRYYFNGRWIADPAVLLRTPRRPDASRRGALALGLRWLEESAPATALAEALRRRLPPFRDHLFHSPNFLLPAGCGLAVATIHDLSIIRYPETHPPERLRAFDKAFPRTLRSAAHLITDSEAVRREVVDRFGWAAARVTAVPLGVGEHFAPRPAAALARQLQSHGLLPGGYALCVSTVEPRKRVDRLLRAYARLPAELATRFPLVLAGDRGWLSGGTHESLARAGDRVRYLGFVGEEALPALYAGARAFLYPSAYEGFGLPVLEAMASGIPVLSSDAAALSEVGGDAALRVDPEDERALADGIRRVLLDEAWRDVARARGLEIARRHSWDACAAGTLSVYRGVWEAAFGRRSDCV
jgi:alpha-1,3-rhamnosyl/mannosyltransferase